MCVQDGQLDAEELKQLLMDVYSASAAGDDTTWIRKYDAQLQQTLHRELSKWDTDGDLQLSFSEFCSMIVTKPWLNNNPWTLLTVRWLTVLLSRSALLPEGAPTGRWLLQAEQQFAQVEAGRLSMAERVGP